MVLLVMAAGVGSLYYLKGNILKESEPNFQQEAGKESESDDSYNSNLEDETEEGAETAISGIKTFPGLKEGDYVDIRMVYPNGENYVVLNRKRLCGIREERGESIYLFQMTEKEQLWYSSAQSDLKTYEGSSLIAVRYASSEQQASTVTYLPNQSVLVLYSKDGNITENQDAKQLAEQRQELEERLKEQNGKKSDLRN